MIQCCCHLCIHWFDVNNRWLNCVHSKHPLINNEVKNTVHVSSEKREKQRTDLHFCWEKQKYEVALPHYFKLFFAFERKLVCCVPK